MPELSKDERLLEFICERMNHLKSMEYFYQESLPGLSLEASYRIKEVQSLIEFLTKKTNAD